MSKRGDQARESVKNTIMAAFSNTNNFVGIADKKIYVTAEDGIGGEKIQFAISMTMPKTPLSESAIATTSNETAATPKTSGPVILAAEDEAMVDKLMEKLGIED